MPLTNGPALANSDSHRYSPGCSVIEEIDCAPAPLTRISSASRHWAIALTADFIGGHLIAVVDGKIQLALALGDDAGHCCVA